MNLKRKWISHEHWRSGDLTAYQSVPVEFDNISQQAQRETEKD